MTRFHFAIIGLMFALCVPSLSAQDTVADVLADPALDLTNPADRARAVERIQAIENANRDRAHAKARAMGVPIREVKPNGTVTEIMGLDEKGDFLIYSTRNANAAISSAANLVYPAPYNLDGTDIVVGVWDSGDVRNTHQEFGGRVTIKNNFGFTSHATHVGGTIAAAGVSATAKGMAPNTLIDSYHWGSDDSEMIAAGAASPGEVGKITISNHSYGFARGWNGNTWTGTGTDQNAYAAQFGQYSSKASSWDSISYNAPFYLIFHSAGNDNTDNPANGAQVTIGGSTVTYDRTIHPPGDGLYRNTTTNSANGYENIGDQANSKNIMVVGAVNDAVTSGVRDPSKATLASFSSRGPTDDGRIKPDIVANGVGVTSTESSGDTAYSSKSGTSMSGPSAAGSAALLVDLYRSLFPGSDMRASTLKGLILHTATDIGNPGPDYHFGWGLIDTKTAADLIIDHHANPEKNRMVEDQLTTAAPSKSYTFTWDGVSPIRATLNWTDPASASTTAHDSRISRLVNDLDLKIIAPNGTQHYPYVMPFVGTWTVESMSTHATTGINSTDNVEQVLIQNPAQSGVWTIEITHKGGLTNNLQDYSLLTDGLSAAPLSMEVARGESIINVGGADGISGTSVGAGTQLTYTISNVGGGQLALTTPVTISGQQNCSVTVSTQPATQLNAGGSTNLVTTVTPAAGGTWSFNVSIANNDPEKSPYHWHVTGIAGSSSSTTQTFTAAADTYINAAATGTNYGSETIFSIWNRGSGNPGSFRYGLLRFDLSSIPADTTLTSASLDFVQNNTVVGSVEIYEATGAWTEVGATWDNSSGLIGNTIYGTASAPATVAGAVPSINLNATGLTKVQSWVNTPSGNHGFSVKTDNTANGGNIDLRSREHATSAHHPKLTITYGSGSTVQAPLMIVSGNDGVISNGGTDSVSGTQEGVGTQLTYPIQNLGDANLTMTTPVTATALSNCSITVNTQPASPVAVSGSTNLVLTITPTSAGAWSATVSISNNDSDKNPYTWTISGSAFGSHTLTYDGNNADSGTAPVDANNPYIEGATVTVLDNTGGLTKAGFSFDGWNTAADGSGTAFAEGATFNLNTDTTLYANWNSPPTVDAGSDQTIYLTGAAPWTPADTSTVAWFDAADSGTITQSGGAVSQWNDKSGNNHHATQGTGGNQPTYNSSDTRMNNLPTIGYDQAYKFLNTPSLAAIRNVYVVTYYDDPDNSFDNHRVLFSDTGNSLKLQGTGSSWVAGAGFDKYRDGSTTSSDANALPMGPTLWTAKGTASHTNKAWRILGGANGWQYWEYGAVGEVILTDGTEDLATQQKIEGYLAHKWGTAANLPAEHPYKNAAPGSPTAMATLNGTVSDVDGDLTTTQWIKAAGPTATVTFDNDTVLNTTATFTEVGTYTLRLTANDGFQQAFDEVNITVAQPPLTVSIADAEISEDGGTTTAIITRIGTSGALEVTLTSSDTGEATVPATATIADGLNSVNVTITGVPDGIADGTQTVTITASAEGNVDGTAMVDVTDVDLTEFESWAAGHATLTDTTTTVDFDGGGLATGLEYVLGGDPTSAADDAAIQPVFDNTDANYFIYTYRRSDIAAADPNTSIEVEYGGDLATWTTAIHNGTNILISANDDAAGVGIDLVEVRIHRDLLPDGKLFSRLKVVITRP